MGTESWLFRLGKSLIGLQVPGSPRMSEASPLGLQGHAVKLLFLFQSDFVLAGKRNAWRRVKKAQGC